MTETTKNSQPSQTDGTSTPAKDSHVQQHLTAEEAERRRIFYRKMAYIEMKKLRPKHPHV